MKNLDLFNSTLELKSINDTSFVDATNFNWTYNNITHFFVAKFPQSFRANYHYRFSAKFKGYTTNDELGFYKSSYTDENGQKKYVNYFI